jgi:hypothetical protein
MCNLTRLTTFADYGQHVSVMFGSKSELRLFARPDDALIS